MDKRYGKYARIIIYDVGLSNMALITDNVKTIMNEGLEITSAVFPCTN